MQSRRRGTLIIPVVAKLQDLILLRVGTIYFCWLIDYILLINECLSNQNEKLHILYVNCPQDAMRVSPIIWHLVVTLTRHK